MSLAGKKGLVMGVANNRSIATAIAEVLHQQGAELGFSYLPDNDGRDKMHQRVSKAVAELDAKFILACDVSKDDDIEQFFCSVQQQWSKVDFLIHAIAYAPLDDLRCPTLEASRSGFLEAINISVYSLIAIANRVAPLMSDGGSIVTLTYYGGEKVVDGYNMMGVCKAALDHSVRYLAYDLGRRNIRVNSLSPGPLRTLASSAIANFSQMQKANAGVTPLKRQLVADDVGQLTAFMVSDHAAAISGELIHVDNAFHVLAGGCQNR